MGCGGPPLNRLARIGHRVRHAGARNASAALIRRLGIRAGIGPLSGSLTGRTAGLSQDQFLGAIDFGGGVKGDLAGCFLEESEARHFLDGSADCVRLMKGTFPEHVRRTVQAAEAVCRHEFRLLGREARFGREIDWFWCPETGGSWPPFREGGNEHVHFGSERPGDIKYPWELNRHQHFVTLSKAYLYTGDDKYVRELVGQMVHWRQVNPCGEGHNWASALEVGIRILSWSHALWLCRSSESFRSRGLETCLTGLYEHARHLSASLTTHWLVRNNHLVGETAGLFVFSVLFPAFRESSGWRAKALTIFTREIEEQIFADGVNKEQATGYHRFVAEFLFLVLRLAELNGVEVRPVLRQRLERMLDYENAVIPPDGAVPLIGDCDDGRAFVFSEEDAFTDWRSLQAAGAVMFGREDFRRAAGKGNEEALWLLGATDWKRFVSMPGGPVPRRSSVFREGGQAILRAGSGPESTMLVLRWGPFGMGMSASCAHSHGDLLAPVIYWRGSLLAVDSGTYAYLCETGRRDAFRSTASHNTMAPRGAEQAEMFPLWNWGVVPKTGDLRWAADDAVTRFSARMASSQGYTHVRQLTLERDPLRITIEDTLEQRASEGPVDWHLHLAPGIGVRSGGVKALVLYDEVRDPVMLSYEGFDDWAVADTWYSPSYHVRMPNRRLRLTTRGKRLSTRVVLSDVHGM